MQNDLPENVFPITPPPELVQQWHVLTTDYLWSPLEQTSITITTNRLNNVATQAAQWGADQELEACCERLHQALALILTVMTLSAPPAAPSRRA
jgi:hypothetical protein